MTEERRYNVFLDVLTRQFHVSDSLASYTDDVTFASEDDAQHAADEWERQDGMWSDEQKQRDAEREQFGEL